MCLLALILRSACPSTERGLYSSRWANGTQPALGYSRVCTYRLVRYLHRNVRAYVVFAATRDTLIAWQPGLLADGTYAYV